MELLRGPTTSSKRSHAHSSATEGVDGLVNNFSKPIKKVSASDNENENEINVGNDRNLPAESNRKNRHPPRTLSRSEIKKEISHPESIDGLLYDRRCNLKNRTIKTSGIGICFLLGKSWIMT